MKKLSHLDSSGHARMVDVSDKPVTARTARAEGQLRCAAETFAKARAAAPGWDVYVLEQEWREWIANKEPTKRPDAAFVAFCRKRFQNQGQP